ncbi:MAG: hypothetical protein LC687_00625 [Actinobacteria bacterium]|nr:hypothetical protein [Actinomycetota bacterium]
MRASALTTGDRFIYMAQPPATVLADPRVRPGTEVEFPVVYDYPTPGGSIYDVFWLEPDGEVEPA